MNVTLEVSSSGCEGRTKPPDPFGERAHHEPTDLRRAECPCCQKTLKKIPAAKTKCPHCKQSMYVPTRPEDHARVLVGKEEADRIDAYWRVARSAPEPDFRFLVNKEQVDAERARLGQQFLSKGCSEPSDDDVKWGLLNRMSLQHAKDGDWGLYRNTRLTMADFLTRRMKLTDALRVYLEVCTLDLNGATNNNAQKTLELLKEFPDFDLRQASAAPVVLSQVDLIAAELEMNREGLKDFYMVKPAVLQMTLPLSPRICWIRLEHALNDLSEDENP